MNNSRTDQRFYNRLLLVVAIIAIVLIWPYTSSVVLAIVFAIVLQPLHRFFLRNTGDRVGIATALTVVTTILLVGVPLLFGAFLLFDSFAAVAGDAAVALRQPDNVLMTSVKTLEEWIASTGLAEQFQLGEPEIAQSVSGFAIDIAAEFLAWLTSIGTSTYNLIVPAILFISLLGTFLANGTRIIQLIKEISPLDDAINQLFLDRLNIMARAMMLSIVVIAVIQGVVTGLIMAIGSTPHILPLTLLAILFSILPIGAAVIAIPVGLVHFLVGNTWQGAMIVLASVTVVASLDNQLRPLLVSKDAYLNRPFVLLSVFSGVALFGFMGVVYGPLIMIFVSTTLEVYLKYYRPDLLTATVELDDGPQIGQTAGDDEDTASTGNSSQAGSDTVYPCPAQSRGHDEPRKI
jgi:predicted PurR-regulated permease PerM